MESKVEIQLLKRRRAAPNLPRERPDQITHEEKEFFVRVRLHSNVQRGRISFKDVEMGRNFRARIEQAGADLAVHQNVLFLDNHDPSEIANTARQVAIEILSSV